MRQKKVIDTMPMTLFQQLTEFQFQMKIKIEKIERSQYGKEISPTRHQKNFAKKCYVPINNNCSVKSFESIHKLLSAKNDKSEDWHYTKSCVKIRRKIL